MEEMCCARDSDQKKAEMHPELVVWFISGCENSAQEHRCSGWLCFLFLSKLYSETSSLLSYPLPVVVVMEAVEGGGCEETIIYVNLSPGEGLSGEGLTSFHQPRGKERRWDGHVAY